MLKGKFRFFLVSVLWILNLKVFVVIVNDGKSMVVYRFWFKGDGIVFVIVLVFMNFGGDKNNIYFIKCSVEIINFFFNVIVGF